MLKRLMLAASLAILTSGAAVAASGEVEGTYDVLGKNPDGSEYKGTATIEVTSANTCRITWQTGASSSDGICMRNGSSFAAGCVLGDKVGLVVYDMKDDGSMVGLWTIADQAGVGSEVLTPQH
jgi:hypothetical protein